MIDTLDQRTETCPGCGGPLTRVRARFLCLSFERDCDYKADRHTPMRITQPEMIQEIVRKNGTAASTTEKVVAFIHDHPWSTVREIAGALGCDDVAVRDALRQRADFGIVRVRSAVARCPYRYAHESVTTGPDTERDLAKTVIPWSSGFKPARDEDDRVAT